MSPEEICGLLYWYWTRENPDGPSVAYRLQGAPHPEPGAKASQALMARGLLEYRDYSGTQLTPEGRQAALQELAAERCPHCRARSS